ncbi:MULTISPECIES: transposase [Oscillatoriales]|uniref:IS110 family transposase n=2 Tax=Limnospira platensis TaxID=118562 RepID=UPI0007A0E209|nr:transposase [Arthrospira platensis YZ]QQW30932.1 IS110 family transposase [Arthrospira sp. PCC 9108]
MNSLIVGLDVSSSWCDAVWLEFMPAGALRDFYESPAFAECHRKLEANAKSIQFLVSLEPSVVILEPTRTYSRFWIDCLHREGIPVLKVDQTMIKDTRKSYGGTSNKSDPYDALLMVATYFQHYQIAYDRRYWVRERPPEVAKIEQCLRDIGSFNKPRTQTINQAKSRLVYEFPAKAKVRVKKESGKLDPDKLPAWWGWACGWTSQGSWEIPKGIKTKFDNEYAKAIAAGEGTGISEVTARLAQQICMWHQSEAMVEQELLSYLNLPEFDCYHRVFDKFGFGCRERGWLLTRCVPFDEMFKCLPKSKAMRRFRQLCGLGATQVQSGKADTRSSFTGSKETRSTLHQFVVRAIERGTHREQKPGGGAIATTPYDCLPKSPEAHSLRVYWVTRAYHKGNKVSGAALKAARNATSRKLAEMLFKALWDMR